MVRKIEVTVPLNLRQQIETLLRGDKSVHHVVVIPCESNIVFQFKVVNKRADAIIEKLTTYGVATGSKKGSIDVVALRTSKPRVRTQRGSEKKKKVWSYYDRLPFDEIEETIDGQLHLTFDYLALIVVGAVIAGVGLLTDSSVSVVASMLVSPLMGPILGMTFGYVINKPKMYKKAFRNEIIGVLVCFLTGAILGFVSAPFVDPITSHALGFGRNTQMSSRGNPNNLIWGALIAMPSGMGVALGVSSDQVSALIGVAISAALLPPITNSGICLCIGLVLYFQGKPTRYVNDYLELGGISMALFIMNWFLIFIFGIIMFKIKKVNQTHAKLERLAKYNEMITMSETSTTNGSDVNKSVTFGQPLMSGDYGTTGPVVIGIGNNNNNNNGSNLGDGINTPSMGSMTNRSSKHKKSMTADYMVDNQAMQGDNIFDTVENQNNTNNSNNYNSKSKGVMGVTGAPSSAQLKAIIESNGNVLERRLSENDGTQGDLYASTVALKKASTGTDPDTRLRHGSLGRQ